MPLGDRTGVRKYPEELLGMSESQETSHADEWSWLRCVCKPPVDKFVPMYLRMRLWEPYKGEHSCTSLSFSSSFESSLQQTHLSARPRLRDIFNPNLSLAYAFYIR